MRRLLFLAVLLASPLAAQDWPTPLPPKELVTHLLERPCRVLDTRELGCQAGVIWPPSVSPYVCREGALAAGETRHLQLQSMWVEACGGEVVPLGALGIVATLTAVGGSGPGHLLLYNPEPASGPTERPLASSLNFAAGQTVASSVTAALGQFQFQTISIPFMPDLALYAHVAGGGEVHVVLDVVGYLAERQ